MGIGRRAGGIGLDSCVCVFCCCVDNKTSNRPYVTGMNRFNVIIRQQQSEKKETISRVPLTQ